MSKSLVRFTIYFEDQIEQQVFSKLFSLIETIKEIFKHLNSGWNIHILVNQHSIGVTLCSSENDKYFDVVFSIHEIDSDITIKDYVKYKLQATVKELNLNYLVLKD